MGSTMSQYKHSAIHTTVPQGREERRRAGARESRVASVPGPMGRTISQYRQSAIQTTVPVSMDTMTIDTGCASSKPVLWKPMEYNGRLEKVSEGEGRGGKVKDTGCASSKPVLWKPREGKRREEKVREGKRGGVRR